MSEAQKLRSLGWGFVLLLAALSPGVLVARTTSPSPSSRITDPKSVDRAQYDINLSLDFDSRSYVGSERVRWINRSERSTSSIYFHLYSNVRLDEPRPVQLNFNAGAINVTQADEPRIEISSVRSASDKVPLAFSLDDDGTTLRVNLRETVPPGSSAEVLIEFKGSVPEIDPEETGIVTHVIKQVSAALRDEREIRRARDINFRCRGLMLLGTFYPVLVVHDGDDWRRKIEPSVGDLIFNEVADYLVTVKTSPGVTVVASGKEVSSRPGEESSRTFAGTSVRDFAVLAGRGLKTEEAQVGNTTVRSVFLPEHERAGKRVLTVATNAVRIFSNRFGPTPFTNINLSEAPLVAGLGSTAFAGLNVIASAFYIDFESPSMRNLPEIIREQQPSMEESLEWTVAHLVAHQWWGSAVGNDQAREPVLDEALSSWSASLYYKEVHGEERTQAVLNNQLLGVYRVYRTFGGEDMDANRPARDYRNSFQYAAIVSAKGALMFIELERLLGRDRFFTALQSYYQANLFEIAELDDLRGAFVAEAPIEQRRTIARTFNRWLASKRGDEDIAKPDPELAKSLGLPANVAKEKSGERNALTAFARVGRFFWQQMTRIR